MYKLETETKIFDQGYNILGAIDEAGRGPLAGPVVAACVVCEPDMKLVNKHLEKLKDSKKLSEKRREALYDVIHETFSEVGIGICDHKTVDKVNILQASFLAMKKAISSIKNKPDYIILDGRLLIPNFSTKQAAIINGDNLVFSIAAASIIAKVSRDRIMREIHSIYPQYGFDKHKGYGTKLHFENLTKYGPSPIHRTSFGPVKQLLKKN